MTVNIVSSEVEIKEKTTKEESSDSLFMFVYLIIIFLIVENIIFLYFLKPNLRESVSRYLFGSYSRILKWYAQRKIESLDSKISRISENVQAPDYSSSIEPMQMDTSSNRMMQRQTFGDISKDTSILNKDEVYNSDSYNKDTNERIDGIKSDDSVVTKSFKQNDEHDINSRVDRLIVSKTEQKTLSDFEKSVEKIIDNYKTSKGFDRDN
jgi:hypothetical protein